MSAWYHHNGPTGTLLLRSSPPPLGLGERPGGATFHVLGDGVPSSKMQ